MPDILNEITVDNFSMSEASNQPIFSLNGQYKDILAAKSRLTEEWAKIGTEKQREHGDIKTFMKSYNAIDPSDPSVLPLKNTYLLLEEVAARVSRQEPLKPLGIEPLDFDDATIELAESLENANEIRELYRIRKANSGKGSKSGINIDEALKIKNCFSQGRELFLSGRDGSLMVKPLNFFYALTAYTYGIIILNNPLRYRKDMLPGSHGMSYLPTTIQAQFGGDSPRGTFSDLVGAFPTHLIMKDGISFNIDCSPSIIDFYNKRFETSLGTLISMVPEMADYYKLTTGRESRCFPLEIVRANDPRSVVWEFHIGNGETRPSQNSIVNSFEGLATNERFGKTVVQVPATQYNKLRSLIYVDLRGNLWFVDNPFHPILLPEVATHFLITSIFSSIMRYRPDEWGSVLLNEVHSNTSLLTRHYFSSFQKKFLLLVIRSISRYYPFTR